MGITTKSLNQDRLCYDQDHSKRPDWRLVKISPFCRIRQQTPGIGHHLPNFDLTIEADKISKVLCSVVLKTECMFCFCLHIFVQAILRFNQYSATCTETCTGLRAVWRHLLLPAQTQYVPSRPCTWGTDKLHIQQCTVIFWIPYEIRNPLMVT